MNNINSQMKTTAHICSVICSQLVERAGIKVEQNEFVKGNINDYSSHRVIFVVNELGNQIFNDLESVENFREDIDPANLCEDNLMPINNFQPKEDILSFRDNETSVISEKVVERKASKKYDSKRSIPGVSAKGKSSRVQSVNSANPQLKKLDNLIETEDLEIQKCRRERAQRFQEQENLRKNIKISDHKINKNEVINYDYDGKFIKVKEEKKKHLVSKGLSGHIEIENTKKNKESIQKQTEMAAAKLKQKTMKIQTKPVTLEKEKVNVSKRKRMEREEEKKKINAPATQKIQFSMIKNPLGNFDAKQGVKAIFHTNVIEGARKENLSLNQIRKNISSRNLSKDEYCKIKAESIRVLPKNVHTQNNEEEEKGIRKKTAPLQEDRQSERKRARSSMRRSITDTGEQKVNVEDLGLKKIMIQKLEGEYENKFLRSKNESPISRNKNPKPELNKLDQFNINYSRKRQQDLKEKIVPESVDIQFPKISQKNSVQIMKARQRVKDAAQMRKTMTKKFEQILRV